MEKFKQAEIIERFYLLDVLPKLFIKYDYDYFFTPIDSKNSYDAVVTTYSKKTGKALKTFIIEMKVRNTHFDELIMEIVKYKRLKSVSKIIDASMLYVNVTPRGYFIFNEDIITNSRVDEGKFNKQTMTSTDDKIDKLCIYLDSDKARQIECNVNEDLLLKNIEFHKRIEKIL